MDYNDIYVYLFMNMECVKMPRERKDSPSKLKDAGYAAIFGESGGSRDSNPKSKSKFASFYSTWSRGKRESESEIAARKEQLDQQRAESAEKMAPSVAAGMSEMSLY